ncbi:hypothetical protein IQ238_23005 [Pleurocapsales cyanobacterium LEGE 06147]|nr:hypothetical protein [Pleurocapsales cyanobacterium LEGE 06147]
MSNLWEKIALITAVFLSLAGLSRRAAIADQFSQLQHRSPLLLAQSWRVCQQLGNSFEEIYAFETQNYYINICRRGQEFYYYRQSKSAPERAVLLPAERVFGGNIYQAVDGKITYFAGLNSDGYYSSVMHNNNEIIFEPELKAASSYRRNTLTSSNDNSDLNLNNSNLESYDRGEEDWRVCTDNRTDINPRLSGWQRFIGQSPETIGEYAVEQGHSFTYSDRSSDRAFVNTKDGLVVTLNLNELQETINRICVNPIANS